MSLTPGAPVIALQSYATPSVLFRGTYRLMEADGRVLVRIIPTDPDEAGEIEDLHFLESDLYAPTPNTDKRCKFFAHDGSVLDGVFYGIYEGDRWRRTTALVNNDGGYENIPLGDVYIWPDEAGALTDRMFRAGMYLIERARTLSEQGAYLRYSDLQSELAGAYAQIEAHEAEAEGGNG